MKQIQCPKCKTIVQVEKIEKDTKVDCNCGCVQVCLDKNEYISRWRVVNPFEFKIKKR